MVFSPSYNTIQWNLNQNLCIFIQENAFENVVCQIASILSGPHCVKISWLHMLKRKVSDVDCDLLWGTFILWWMDDHWQKRDLGNWNSWPDFPPMGSRHLDVTRDAECWQRSSFQTQHPSLNQEKTYDFLNVFFHIMNKCKILLCTKMLYTVE